MGIEITRRQWENVLQRLSKLESSIRSIENRLKLIEKRLKPQEIYRVVKQQEHEHSTEEKPHIPPRI